MTQAFIRDLGVPETLASALYDEGFTTPDEVRGADPAVLLARVPEWGAWLHARALQVPPVGWRDEVAQTGTAPSSVSIDNEIASPQEVPREDVMSVFSRELGVPNDVARALEVAGYNNAQDVIARGAESLAQSIPVFRAWYERILYGPPGTGVPGWLDKDEPGSVGAINHATFRGPNDVRGDGGKSAAVAIVTSTASSPGTPEAHEVQEVHASGFSPPTPPPEVLATWGEVTRGVIAWWMHGSRKWIPVTVVAIAVLVPLYEVGPPLTAAFGYYPPVFYCGSQPCQSFSAGPAALRAGSNGLRIVFEADVHGLIELRQGDMDYEARPFYKGLNTVAFTRVRDAPGEAWELTWSARAGEGGGWIRIKEFAWT